MYHWDKQTLNVQLIGKCCPLVFGMQYSWYRKAYRETPINERGTCNKHHFGDIVWFLEGLIGATNEINFWNNLSCLSSLCVEVVCTVALLMWQKMLQGCQFPPGFRTICRGESQEKKQNIRLFQVALWSWTQPWLWRVCLHLRLQPKNFPFTVVQYCKHCSSICVAFAITERSNWHAISTALLCFLCGWDVKRCYCRP